jgi:hypothetical protein
MQPYSDAGEDRTKAKLGRVLAMIVVAIVATVIPIVWLASWDVPSDDPALLVVYVSSQSPVSADGAYSSVRVAVDNAGDATAEACTVKAYNRLPFTYEVVEAPVLGESEQFDLSARGGRVTTVSLYLPAMSGEALSGGGVSGPVSLRTECENAESPDHGWIMAVPSSVSSSEAS